MYLPLRLESIGSNFRFFQLLIDFEILKIVFLGPYINLILK